VIEGLHRARRPPVAYPPTWPPQPGTWTTAVLALITFDSIMAGLDGLSPIIPPTKKWSGALRKCCGFGQAHVVPPGAYPSLSGVGAAVRARIGNAYGPVQLDRFGPSRTRGSTIHHNSTPAAASQHDHRHPSEDGFSRGAVQRGNERCSSPAISIRAPHGPWEKMKAGVAATT